MDNIEELIRKIKEKNPKRIFLQLPEGLKTRALEIVNAIEKECIEVFLSADTCYGACDLRDDEAKQLKCDLLVNVGHDKFFRDFETSVTVLYYPWKIDLDIDLNKIDFSSIKEEKIGLLTTVQHEDLPETIASKLKKIGKKPVIGGKILGCFTGNAEKIKDRVDCFLFIGSGRFHPLGIKDNKIYFLDLEKRKIEEIDPSYLEKKRYANIFKAKDVDSFGILVSTKKGQFCLSEAIKAKKYLENRNKKAYILIMDEISNEKLEGIKVDAFINTACPRIADERFSKPMINANDLKELFND